jgi:putative flavoprotein involved in K+ transport
MSAVLRAHGLEHVVLERGSVGERWRTERWDSLRFQFPNWSILLPGYTYAGDDPHGFAHYTDICRIIEDYGRAIDAPIRTNTEVVALDQVDGGYVLTTGDGLIAARRVIIATGPFQHPYRPSVASELPSSVHQTDPTRYRGPAELPAGSVLVVGSGASGYQIADELHHAGRNVILSVSRHRRVPRRFRGKDAYWWFEKMGRFDVTIDSFPDRKWPPSTVVTGINGGYDVDVRTLAADGVRVVGRVISVADETVALDRSANDILTEADNSYAQFITLARDLASTGLEDQLAEDVDHLTSDAVSQAVEPVRSINLNREGIATVVWATGYRYDYDWVHAPVFDTNRQPVQQRGITACPGLYFLGLHWMHTFKSGLLSGVGVDAEHLAQHLKRRA